MNSDSKVIIIEDDPASQEYLTSIITSHFSALEICGYAETVEDSIELLAKVKPELVFMDIELKDGLAFEIFESIERPNFEVIFITAFDDFMKKAIDHYAFSFIIKPIDTQKLIDTVQRFMAFKERSFTTHKYGLLSKFLNTEDSIFLIHVGNEFVSLRVNEIIKCCAEKNYTRFSLTTGQSYLASKPLKYYEELLSEKGFFKAHRSISLNIKHIKSIYKKESIVLKNNEKINVSLRNRSNLSHLIQALS